MREGVTHYLKQEKREMGQDVVCWYKFIGLADGETYLLETWNKGNVSYKEYSWKEFDKMDNGEFAGVL